MTMIVVFRVLSPLLSMVVESCLPDTPRITCAQLLAVAIMVFGSTLYVSGVPTGHLLDGIAWIFLNMVLAVGDRVIQRSMLAADQHPVDISLTGVTLLNNFWGSLMMLSAAWFSGEMDDLRSASARLTREGAFWILGSCVVGTAISFSGVWVQQQISATSFLVLVNVNKFGIIFVEAFFMGSGPLPLLRACGASTAIVGGALYASAQAAPALKEAPPVEPRSREVHPLRECLVSKVHKTL
mmetsp:Transcript_59736/g.159000  ORF Transcript_59736/g.159000 Transcript_59736/m.159000 type:complete len:240 (-) Transcript_59736:35-754(-)